MGFGVADAVGAAVGGAGGDTGGWLALLAGATTTGGSWTSMIWWIVGGWVGAG